MEFNFSEDQELLCSTVRDFLQAECTPEQIRALWETDTGRSDSFWMRFAEMGVPGLMVPEEAGGLGLDDRDMVLVLEETGRFGLAEPIVSIAAGVPLLVAIGQEGQPELAEKWLSEVASGRAKLAIEHPRSPFVSDAHVADLLLLNAGDAIHAVPRAEVKLIAQPANDQSQRLFSVEWTPTQATLVAQGETAQRLQEEAFDRGAMACASQQLGVAQQLIDLGAGYAAQRKQFGVAVGSFQAVKHRLANAKVKAEYARSVVYRAAHSVALKTSARSVDVSMAKVAAGEAALFAAKESLQVHGAIGYTYEQDLHIWMKRAWSLDLAFGSGAWHRARIADAVIDQERPAETFGYSGPNH
ncbi:MAG: acyl-CoA dehydrogenase [Deltaproteobacteria bacterium]|nr:acyl-CoA dehydrogenase [Deltaproteobacteria bacterium]